MNIIFLIIASLLYFINKTTVLPNTLKCNAIFFCMVNSTLSQFRLNESTTYISKGLTSYSRIKRLCYAFILASSGDTTMGKQTGRNKQLFVKGCRGGGLFSVATFMTFTNKFSDCLGFFIDSKRFTQDVNVTFFYSTRCI